MEPTFDKDKAQLEQAAKCTVFVIIDHPSKSNEAGSRYYGTAFFISPKLLLTAGHNTVGSHGPLEQVRITYPGLPYINLTTLQGRPRISTIDCKVVGTLYTREHGSISNDIAILDAGSHNAADYLQISQNLPMAGAKVNIIGYPGAATEKWLLIHEGLEDVATARRATDKMFPAHRLTITSGSVESAGPMISYRLSTIPGLSGAPVLYNGVAIGISPGWETDVRGSYWTRDCESRWADNLEERHVPNGNQLRQ